MGCNPRCLPAVKKLKSTMTPNQARSVSFKKTTSWKNYGSTNIEDETSELPLVDTSSSAEEAKKFLNRQQSDLHPPIGHGKATILSEVFNISKNLIGGGVLSLSGGIALFANTPSASISAIVWVLILGAAFGYFCVV